MHFQKQFEKTIEQKMDRRKKQLCSSASIYILGVLNLVWGF